MTKVAIIGCGLIGASWAALYLARGFDVVAQDVAADAEPVLRARVAAAWPDLQALGLAAGAVPLDRLAFHADIKIAVQDADFVQECGPDRIEVKRAILAEIEAGVGADVVIASSTSALLASDIQAGARHPGRVLVGHPFNPPHLIPLLEIVRGAQTSDAAVEAARDIYARLNRVVIEPRREVIGHIANRLSAALYREAVHMVAEGIATVADVDRAVAFGPGLRWALMGPHLTYHMGGGAGGFRHYLNHLGPAQEARWAELGQPVLDDATRAALIAGVDAELAELDTDTLAARRDAALVALLQVKQAHGFDR